MGARIILKKADDELRPVGAAIVPETRLRERGRRYSRHRDNAQRGAKNRIPPAIHVWSPTEYSIDETEADDMPFPLQPLKIIRCIPCQPPPTAISIFRVPAISAISAAIRRPTDGPCAGGRFFAPTI